MFNSLKTENMNQDMNQFHNLLKHVKDLEDDFTKFYSQNNKAAGTRVRQAMQSLKGMAHAIRIDIQKRKNTHTAVS